MSGLWIRRQKRFATDSPLEPNRIRTLGPRKPLIPDCTLRTALAWKLPCHFPRHKIFGWVHDRPGSQARKILVFDSIVVV